MARTDMEPSTTTTSNGSTNSRNTSSSEGIRSWINLLNEIDESLSRPMFRLELPRWFEFIFQIPANIFGTTACLTIGPLWVALAAISMQEYSQGEWRINLLRIIVFSMKAIHVVCFYLYLNGNQKFGAKLFWNSLLYPFAYPWSVGILAYTVLGLEVDTSSESVTLTPKEIFSIAVYPLVLWPLVAIIMLELKNATRRTRPARKDIERPNSEHWTQRKKFPLVSNFLAKYSGDQSFPSGDVMMAVLVIGLPLWHADKCQHFGIILPVFSALGRMYVLAHHLSDVVAGCLLTLGLQYFITALGYGIFQAEWWHPFISIGSYVALLHVRRTGKNPRTR